MPFDHGVVLFQYRVGENHFQRFPLFGQGVTDSVGLVWFNTLNTTQNK